MDAQVSQIAKLESTVDNLYNALVSQREVVQGLLQYVERMTHLLDSLEEEQKEQAAATSALKQELATLHNMVDNLLHVKQVVDN